MAMVPDPHGQAALMLCESFAHMLIERGLVSAEEVVDAIRGIIEVKQELAGTSERVVVSLASIALLNTLMLSLSAASEAPALRS